jgi:hypothetical protein
LDILGRFIDNSANNNGKTFRMFFAKVIRTLTEGKKGDGMVISFGVSCHALPMKKKSITGK